MSRLVATLTVVAICLVPRTVRGDDRSVLAELLAFTINARRQFPHDGEEHLVRIAVMQASIQRFKEAERTAFTIADQSTRIAAFNAIAKQHIAADDFEGAWRLIPQLEFDKSMWVSICLRQASAGQGREALDRMARLANPAARSAALVDLGQVLLRRGERSLARQAFQSAVVQFKSLDEERVDCVRRALAHRRLGETDEWEAIRRSIVASRSWDVLTSIALLVGENESLTAALEIAQPIPEPRQREAAARIFRSWIDRGDDVADSDLSVLPVDPSQCECDDLRPPLVKLLVKRSRFESALAVARRSPAGPEKLEMLALVARESSRAMKKSVAAEALREARQIPLGAVAIEAQPNAYANLARAEQACGESAAAGSARRCVESALFAQEHAGPDRLSELTSGLDNAVETLLAAGLRADAIQLLEIWKRALVDPRSDWEPFAAQYARIHGSQSALELARKRHPDISWSVYLGVAHFQGKSGQGTKILEWVERFPAPRDELSILFAGCEGALEGMGITSRSERAAGRID